MNCQTCQKHVKDLKTHTTKRCNAWLNRKEEYQNCIECNKIVDKTESVLNCHEYCRVEL